MTDIDMPEMDGISLVSELRQMRLGVGGVFMTGGLRRVGPLEEVLQKPFTSAELIQALANVGVPPVALTSQVDREPYVA